MEFECLDVYCTSRVAYLGIEGRKTHVEEDTIQNRHGNVFEHGRNKG